jgi:hypothetical protein
MGREWNFHTLFACNLMVHLSTAIYNEEHNAGILKNPVLLMQAGAQNPGRVNATASPRPNCVDATGCLSRN